MYNEQGFSSTYASPPPINFWSGLRTFCRAVILKPWLCRLPFHIKKSLADKNSSFFRNPYTFWVKVKQDHVVFLLNFKMVSPTAISMERSPRALSIGMAVCRPIWKTSESTTYGPILPSPKNGCRCFQTRNYFNRRLDYPLLRSQSIKNTAKETSVLVQQEAGLDLRVHAETINRHTLSSTIFSPII